MKIYRHCLPSTEWTMISAACFKISYSLNNIALSLAGAIKIYNLLLKLRSDKQSCRRIPTCLSWTQPCSPASPFSLPLTGHLSRQTTVRLPSPGKCSTTFRGENSCTEVRLRSSSSGTKKQQQGFILTAVFSVLSLAHIKILTT